MAATAKSKGTKMSFSEAIERGIRIERAEGGITEQTPVENAPVIDEGRNPNASTDAEIPVGEDSHKRRGRKLTTDKPRKEIVSSYFTKAQIRLIRAASKNKKISISQYVYDLVEADLESNAERYEEIAKLLDQVEGI